MVHIMTDSAADFSQHEAKGRNLELIPLPITFENRIYLQEHDPGFINFYHLLKEAETIPFTSQASPADYLARFEAALNAGDEVVLITLSSELSSTYQSALTAQAELGCGGIHVVDGYTAVMGQRILVDVALKMRDEGSTGALIAEKLQSLRERVRVYGMVDTLEYLKKGGRISKSVALIGTLMNVKPMIEVRDGKVNVIARALGSGAGIKLFFDLIDQGPKIDRDYPIYFGFANTSHNCERFQAEAQVRYQLGETRALPIGGVVGTHIGPGATAIAYIEET